jgi:hypothetical protein
MTLLYEPRGCDERKHGEQPGDVRHRSPEEATRQRGRRGGEQSRRESGDERHDGPGHRGHDDANAPSGSRRHDIDVGPKSETGHVGRGTAERGENGGGETERRKESRGHPAFAGTATEKVEVDKDPISAHNR